MVDHIIFSDDTEEVHFLEEAYELMIPFYNLSQKFKTIERHWIIVR